MGFVNLRYTCSVELNGNKQSLFLFQPVFVYLWIGVWVIRRQNDSWQSACRLSNVLRNFVVECDLAMKWVNIEQVWFYIRNKYISFLYMSDSHSINANISFAFNCYVYIWIRSCRSGLKSMPIRWAECALWSIFPSKPEHLGFIRLNGLQMCSFRKNDEIKINKIDAAEYSVDLKYVNNSVTWEQS